MKRKKLFSLATSLALAAGLFASAWVPVSAATPTATGTEANPAHVTINKHLSMPEGTTTPVGDATFKFTAVSVDGTAATPSNMPVIPDRKITFAAADAGTVAAGVKTVKKESGNIFDSITFPHAGEYIYTVKEAASGFTLTNNATLSETMQYSDHTYQVQVIVANNAAGTATYIQSISVNNYTTTPTPTVGAKVNDGDDGEGSSFEFDNVFARTNRNDPTNPEDANGKNLRIKKVVAGAGGDYTQYFNFSATVTAPAVVPAGAPTSYKAVISEGGAAIDPTNNGITGAAADHTFTVTPGTALNFKLKHNQQLVLVDAPVGASYVASETPVASYTASYVQTIAGVAGTSTTGNAVTSTAIGEAGANSLVMTNKKADITPTGIVVSNLPYIMVGAFAVAGFAFLMLRKRSR